MKEAVIVSMARTAVGKAPRGTLRNTRPDEMAAAALQDLGLQGATDVIGGFRAWSAAGLPTAAVGAGTVTLAPGAGSAVPLALLPCSPPGRS